VLEELDDAGEFEELDDDESLEVEVFSELDDDESDLTELFDDSRLSVR
jgi:hypothetical protein